MMKDLLLVLGLLILTPSTPGPPGEVGALIFVLARICIVDATKSKPFPDGGFIYATLWKPTVSQECLCICAYLHKLGFHSQLIGEN